MIISSIVLFFSRAICGSGPDVEVPTPVAPVWAAGGATPPGAAAGVAEEPLESGAAPKRPDVGAAAVEDGAGALELVVFPPPNRPPPRDGAVDGVETVGAVVVLLAALNMPPSDGADVFAGPAPKRLEGAGALEAAEAAGAAGAAGLLEPKLNGLGAGALLGAAPKGLAVEVGGALVGGAEPKRPPWGGAEDAVAEGAEPNKLVCGAEVVVAAGFAPNKLVVGVEEPEVAAGAAPNRLLVGGALAAGAPLNKPPAEGAEVVRAGPLPNIPPDEAAGVEDTGAAELLAVPKLKLAPACGAPVG